MRTCYICGTQYISRSGSTLCHSCRSMSPDVKEMLLTWKSHGATYDKYEVQEHVLKRTNWWFDIGTLEYMLPTLAQSGKLIDTGSARYRIP